MIETEKELYELILNFDDQSLCHKENDQRYFFCKNKSDDFLILDKSVS
jgi:hypothetical protein